MQEELTFFKEKYLDHPEVIKEINRRWYKKNKKRIQEYYKTPKGKKVKKEKDRKWKENNPEVRMLISSRASSKRRNLEHSISREYIKAIMCDTCPVFGMPLDFSLGKGRLPSGPSIDRIDPSKGYVEGNVRVMSLKANRILGVLSREEQLKLAHWILSEYSTDSKSRYDI